MSLAASSWPSELQHQHASYLPRASPRRCFPRVRIVAGMWRIQVRLFLSHSRGLTKHETRRKASRGFVHQVDYFCVICWRFKTFAHQKLSERMSCFKPAPTSLTMSLKNHHQSIGNCHRPPFARHRSSWVVQLWRS